MSLDRSVLRAPALLTLASFSLALPRLARADDPTPSCTTTTNCTTTTTCTGSAAALALQPPSVQVTPQLLAPPQPPQYPPPPQYAPPQCPAPPAPYPMGPEYGCPQPPAYAPPVGWQQPYLPQYRLVEKEEANVGMAIAGGSMFLATWGPMAFTGFAAREGKLAIPVLGPMLLAGDLNTHDSTQMLFVVEGLAQATGLALFIAGVATKHKVKVQERITLVPSVTPTGGGLAAFGTF